MRFDGICSFAGLGKYLLCFSMSRRPYVLLPVEIRIGGMIFRVAKGSSSLESLQIRYQTDRTHGTPCASINITT